MIEREAVDDPVLEGANAAAIVHEEPIDIEEPQAEATRKSPGLAPATLIPLIFSGALPLLLRVTVALSVDNPIV